MAPVDGDPTVGVALPATGGVRMVLLFAKTDNRFLGTDLRTSGSSGVGVTNGYGIVDQVGERP